MAKFIQNMKGIFIDLTQKKYFPFLYYFIFWGLCVSPLKPYILEAYSKWFPFVLVENDILQWVIYGVLWLVYSFLAFGSVKSEALNDINEGKNNKDFVEASEKPKTLILLIVVGILFFLVMKYCVLPKVVHTEPTTYTLVAILFAVISRCKKRT